MSSTGPQHIGPADRTQANWAHLWQELDEIAHLAGELRLWVVVGALGQTSVDERPTNCLYIISSRGRVSGRYDERMLSKTKATFMYSPGRQPLVFTARGIRFGVRRRSRGPRRRQLRLGQLRRPGCRRAPASRTGNP